MYSGDEHYDDETTSGPIDASPGTPSPQTTEGLGATPLTARWFHVGLPWSDQPGLIYAGAEDPHVGRFVVDCRDWPDETHFGAAQTVDVVALADGIVRDHNARLDAARLSVPSEALAGALRAIRADIESVLMTEWVQGRLGQGNVQRITNLIFDVVLRNQGAILAAPERGGR